MTRVVLLLCGLPLVAQINLPQQTGSDAPAPLEAVRVTGNRQIPTDKILSVAGLKRGAIVSKADFDAARLRLVETGAFETVGYEYGPGGDGQSYTVTLEVHEIDQTYPYVFDGLAVADEVLREALRAQEPLWGDQIPVAAINRYVDVIVQAGVKAAVTWKVEETVPGVQAIVFHPATTIPNIAEVKFKGNDVLPNATLLRAINDVAVGVPYTEKAVRERLETSIKPLYDARGRIRVAFPKIEAEPAPKVEGVAVTVTVEEGPVYKLGQVNFTGVDLKEATRLAKAADLSKGDTANFDDVKAAVERVEKDYRNKGYLRVSSRVDRDIHDDDRTVNVAVALEPGAQYRFGKLTIVGLDILTEPEIRKAWGAMESRPYQPDYADSFLDRLRTEKVFENLGKTTATPKIDDAAKVVDVTLTFKAPDKADKEAEAGRGR